MFLFLFFSDIVYNTEFHIRVVEVLIRSGLWGERLPDHVTAPGKYYFFLLWYTRYTFHQQVEGSDLSVTIGNEIIECVILYSALETRGTILDHGFDLFLYVRYLFSMILCAWN